MRSLLIACLLATAAQPAEFLLYTGSFTTNKNSKGINVARFDSSTGKLTPIGLAGESSNPSFLAESGRVSSQFQSSARQRWS